MQHPAVCDVANLHVESGELHILAPLFKGLFSNSQRVLHLTNCSYLINILYVRLISTFQCSATCGEAVQVREVVCSENSDCDPDQKPPTLQPCLLPKCLAWKHGPWNTVSILSAFNPLSEKNTNSLANVLYFDNLIIMFVFYSVLKLVVRGSRSGQYSV